MQHNTHIPTVSRLQMVQFKCVIILIDAVIIIVAMVGQPVASWCLVDSITKLQRYASSLFDDDYVS